MGDGGRRDQSSLRGASGQRRPYLDKAERNPKAESDGKPRDCPGFNIRISNAGFEPVRDIHGPASLRHGVLFCFGEEFCPRGFHFGFDLDDLGAD